MASDPNAYARCAGAVGPLLALALLAGGCWGHDEKPVDVQTPHPAAPVVADTGPSLPLSQSTLSLRLWTLRTATALPAEAYRILEKGAADIDAPTRDALHTRGFVCALLTDEELAAFEAALVPPPPAPPPPPESEPKEGAEKKSGDKPAEPPLAPGERPARPQFVTSPTAGQTAPVFDVTNIPVPPVPTWTPIVDGPSRQDSWALLLGETAARVEPGTLRLFARCWPTPGMGGKQAAMHAEFVPVITQANNGRDRDIFSTPTLSTDLASRGLVLARHRFGMDLYPGRSLVLAVRVMGVQGPRTAGPETDAAPTLGGALFGPDRLGTGAPPRVLIIKPSVPSAYRLLAEPSAPKAKKP